jgi:hypothetical protein
MIGSCFALRARDPDWPVEPASLALGFVTKWKVMTELQKPLIFESLPRITSPASRLPKLEPDAIAPQIFLDPVFA